MLKFEAYNLRDLQNFLSFLNQCESTGVTDIRATRQRIQNHIDSRFRNNRSVKRNIKTKKPPICPSCGSGFLIGPYKVDGLIIQRCSRKCGYSEVIA